jgi:hypothetical protein
MMRIVRWWLGRLAFSFIILAAVLAWEGRRARDRGQPATWHYVAAALLAGAGMAGLRERHRPEERSQSLNDEIRNPNDETGNPNDETGNPNDETGNPNDDE